MFKLFNRKTVKKIVISISVIFTFSIPNVLAVHSDKINEAIKKIETSGQKSLDFEKNFLNKYLVSDHNFGELFENKIYNYISKKTSSHQYYGSCSENNINQLLRLDFSKCILDYLEDKYIIQSDTTGIKEKISVVLTLDKLEQNQRYMYEELNIIINLLDDDENTKKFILANTSINENIANYIFSSRLFTDSIYKRQAKKVLVNINPNKEPLCRITYHFLDENEKPVFDTSVSKKAFGAQFGGILSITTKEGTEEKRFFKTHQNGSRFTGFTGELFFSKSISVAQPVNIIELFVYKLLEELEIGPKVKFVVNPFVTNDIYIVTKDLGDKFNIAGKISENECLNLKNDGELVSQITKFDLINRILGLSDLNQGNYGILDNGNQKLIKIIDFRAPSQPLLLNDIIFSSYFTANGEIYHSNDVLVANLLKSKSPEQKIKEGKDAIKKLGLSVEQFKNIVLKIKNDIKNFINKIDNISNIPIKEQIGLNPYYEPEKLEIYEKIIVENFKFVENYFETN